MFEARQLVMTTTLHCVACSLVLSIGACTEDHTPSVIQPNAHVSPDAAAEANRRILHQQSSDQVSQSDEGKSKEWLSDIGFMQADTDGDKVLDGIELCQDSKVCITRGRTNEQIIYADPSWARLRILDSQDTDGRDAQRLFSKPSMVTDILCAFASCMTPIVQSRSIKTPGGSPLPSMRWRIPMA